MATSKINLSRTAYVQINTGYGQLIIESITGDVHIVLNTTQPAVTNTAFHKLTDRQRLVFDRLDTNVWALAKNEGSHAVVTEFAATTNALGGNDLVTDAWGRQKVINDFSLFHGVWTYDVPDRIWEESKIEADGSWTALSATGTNVTSSNALLSVASGTTANEGGVVSSKRHPRYQPNRGHLYSTAIICPTAEADGIRKWGLYTEDNGVYFELEGDGADYTLYACRLSGGSVETRQAITLPSGFDIEKGHVYDIQYQWRGVGNYKWFIDLQEVYTDSILGTLTALSVENPANPATFESVTHTTTEITLQVGCVDVTSEGGRDADLAFASVATGLLQADATGRAIIGIKVPRTVSGEINTRDLLITKATSWCRDEAALQVYVGRDTLCTNLDGLTWSNITDSNTQYLEGGETSALDTAFQTDRSNMNLLVSEWNDLEAKNEIINPDPDRAPFYVTAGDILIVCVQSIAGDDDTACTLYMAEEI